MARLPIFDACSKAPQAERRARGREEFWRLNLREHTATGIGRPPQSVNRVGEGQKRRLEQADQPDWKPTGTVLARTDPRLLGSRQLSAAGYPGGTENLSLGPIGRDLRREA